MAAACSAGSASRCSSSRSRSCSAACSASRVALVRIYGGPISSRIATRLHHLLPRHAAALPALPRLLRRRPVPARSSTASACGGSSATPSSAPSSPSRSTRPPTRPRSSAAPSQSVHRGQWEAALALGLRWSDDPAHDRPAAGRDRRAAPARQRAGHHGEIVGGRLAGHGLRPDGHDAPRLRALLRSVGVPLRRAALSVHRRGDPPRLGPGRTAADAASPAHA